MTKQTWKQIAVVSSLLGLLLTASLAGAQAQQTVPTNTNVAVPPLVSFNGALTDENGKPLTGITGVTFSLYENQQGGAPLWIETQNVQPDKTGSYTVMLGSTSSSGLPANLFTAGQAHWLGVQAQGQAEQPRVMLLSVPYAMKAGDAQTVGGLPASAFMLTPSNTSNSATAPSSSSGSKPSKPNVGGSGQANYLAMWTDNNGDLGDSVIYQYNGNIGIGIVDPAVTLDVNGTALIGGELTVSGKEVLTANSSYEALDVTQSTGTGDGIHGNTSSATGIGVYGSSPNIGVEGASTDAAGTGIGVYGSSQYIGVVGASTGSFFGVMGTSSYGGFSFESAGVYGQYLSQSTTCNNSAGCGYGGVYGDGGSGPNAGVGVIGGADNNYAGSFTNTSKTYATILAHNEAGGPTDPILQTQGGKQIGCTIDGSGTVLCSGTLNSVVTTDSGARKLSLYATQSTENWFEDAGSGQLSHGSAQIALDPAFAQTVNTGVEYHVFLTPNGDCKGLYVSQKDSSSFEVRELSGGTSNIAFDYRIMAKRKGYETVRLTDVTERYKQQEEARQQRIQQRQQALSAKGTVATATMPHQ